MNEICTYLHPMICKHEFHVGTRGSMFLQVEEMSTQTWILKRNVDSKTNERMRLCLLSFQA